LMRYGARQGARIGAWRERSRPSGLHANKEDRLSAPEGVFNMLW
jgi:hypothetical protein